MVYSFLLSAHNIVRWVVVALAVWTLVSAYTGLLQTRPWTETDRKSGSFFTISMDIQLVIGLLLYFVFGPWARAILSDFGAAMSNDELRYFAVEHFLVMIIAVALAHIGTVRIRRAEGDTAKFRNAAIWYTLSVLAVLGGIPWDRPLFRLFGAVIGA